MAELKDTDNIDCHLQNIGMGTLICKAAKQTGEHATNEVAPENCFGCNAGKIYRELGCDAVLPQIRIMQYMGEQAVQVEQLLCKIKKRFTTYDQCKQCNLKAAETTKNILSQAKGIFTDNEFYASYKDIDKARISIRDGKFDTAITNSISSLESTMKIIHEKTGTTLPQSMTVTDLFKSTRKILGLDSIDNDQIGFHLTNSLNGVIFNLGNLRNSLSDAHGSPPFLRSCPFSPLN